MLNFDCLKSIRSSLEENVKRYPQRRVMQGIQMLFNYINK